MLESGVVRSLAAKIRGNFLLILRTGFRVVFRAQVCLVFGFFLHIHVYLFHTFTSVASCYFNARDYSCLEYTHITWDLDSLLINYISQPIILVTPVSPLLPPYPSCSSYIIISRPPLPPPLLSPPLPSPPLPILLSALQNPSLPTISYQAPSPPPRRSARCAAERTVSTRWCCVTSVTKDTTGTACAPS